MLSQEVFRVIVAIRCSHHYVDMLTRRLARHGARVSDRILMVELDQDDRAMNAIVEHGVVR